MKIEKITSERNTLGEAGFWDVTSQTLTWVDIHQKTVFNYSPHENKVKRLTTDQTVSIAVPRRKEPGYLVSQHNRLDFLSLDGQQMEFVSADRLGLEAGVQLNDGKCDAKGRLWIGSLKPDRSKTIAEWPTAGGLFSVTEDGAITKHDVTLKVSNGLDWTSDNRVFLLADTADSVIYAFDFDLDAGQISRRRKALEWSPAEIERNGRPDGLTLDANDKLWVAMVYGSAVVQYDLETGKELQRINFAPTSFITCCNFGGQGLDELYVTSGTFNLTQEQLEGQPDAGVLYRVTGIGVKGRAPHPFAG